MRKSFKIGALQAVLLSLICLSPLKAETMPDYDLRLNMEKSGSAHFNESKVQSQSHVAELSLDIALDRDVKSEETRAEFEHTYYLPFNSVSLREYNPVITFNNSYDVEENVAAQKNGSGFSFADEYGRWRFAGSFNQTYLRQQNDKETSEQNVNSNSQLFRTSSRSLKADESVPTVSPLSPESEAKTSVASDYYLEAVYSFNPTVKGKVSFQQSSIDDFNTGKSVQLEGIVETRPNILIKAGINNSFDNDVNNGDPNLSKEKRVWTEFILKF